jgi:hypothetical protein
MAFESELGAVVAAEYRPADRWKGLRPRAAAAAALET